MIRHQYIIFSILTSLFFIACSNDSEDFEEKTTANTTNNNNDLDVEKFIYRGMSDIYLYKNDVAVLADNFFSSQNDKESYLNTFSTPEKLFDALTASKDKFSYLLDDYEEMNKMTSGTVKTNGMNYGLVSYCNTCTEIFGYVRLVIPGTTAENMGVERGMIFTRVDGKQLTKSNFNSLLNADSYTIGLAKIEGNTIENLDQTISLSSSNFPDNPIGTSKVIIVDGKKIGYLYYDSFSQDYDEELNNAIGNLKAEGVSDLVLDLRYNGGGSVRTATDLAAMITGQFAGQLFMKEKWNDKYQSYYESRDPESLLNNFNTTLRTGTTINSLNLNRVFVLTTKSSASASELIINGLEPYIEVIHIGDVTTGKFQASVALYDSPNFSKNHSALNTSHTYAMQPLVLKSHNAKDVSDYVNGLNPDYILKEDVKNLGILGDPNEPLLKLALDVIKGNRISIPDVQIFPNIGESGMFKLDFQKMYIDNIELPDVK